MTANRPKPHGPCRSLARRDAGARTSYIKSDTEFLVMTSNVTHHVPYIPGHVVIQAILPYAHLPIDTRLHFKLPPRRLGRGHVHEVLQRHLEYRITSMDGNLVAFSESTIDTCGLHGDRAFDNVVIDMYFYWDDTGSQQAWTYLIQSRTKYIGTLSVYRNCSLMNVLECLK